jgi:hypothetical protein
MHKFLIYFTTYFYLTCFGLFLAHLQRQVYNCGNGSNPPEGLNHCADTILRRVEPLPEIVHLPLKMG